MDTSLKSQKGETALRDTFKDSFNKFLTSRNEFPEFEKISMRLPFGLVKEHPLPFDRYAAVQKLDYMSYSCGSNSLTRNHFPMVISHSRGRKHNKTIVLSQKFETFSKDSKKSLFSTKQYVNKKSGYLYRWSSTGSVVTISKLIGTTNINKVKLQVDNLLNECQRFIFVYCQG